MSFPYLIPDTAQGGGQAGSTSGSLGVSGTFTGTANIAAFSVTQPTRVFIFMIKY